MYPARRRAAFARLLGTTVAVAALAGFGADRAHAAYSAQIAAQTLRITGDAAGDRLALRLQAGSPGILQVDVGNDGTADFSFDRSRFTKIQVDAGAGDDLVRIDEANGLFTNVEATTLNGQTGGDTLTGGSADETISGGDGADAIFGARGSDTRLLGGAGPDTFTWNPGDGSDGMDGGGDADVMDFNGANVSEKIEASASAGELRLFRDVANITMLSRAIETVDLDVLGGADNVTVGSLGSSGVTLFDVDLAAAGGGGDGAEDSVRVVGTGGPDDVQVVPNGSAVNVTGLPTETRVGAPEAASDSLVVETAGGQDTVAGSNGLANLVNLTLDGGAGQDDLRGGDGADVFVAGDGADFVDGNRGNDLALLGAGNDTFQWDPGDGNDVVEGQDGEDVMLFNGANVSELFDVSANGGRVRFTRNVANIVMDLDDVERIDTHAFGGADTATVNDLSGTDLTRADFDLEGAPGSGVGDTQPDEIRVVGTAAGDSVQVGGGANGVRVRGLVPEVRIDRSEPALDTLTLDLGNGVDSVDASSLHPGTIELAVDAGPGDESLIGSDGDDTFVWNPGDGSDRIAGGTGGDTLLFNGSAVNERFDVSASGARVRFVRDVGNIVMDLDDVEQIDANALGGSDTATVHDLSGTDVTRTSVDLGAGDGQADSVVVEGTNGDDVVSVGGSGTELAVTGLASELRVASSEAANDRLTVNLLAGDDALHAGGLAAGVIQLVGNGGGGDDVLIGSAGPDVLNGDAGDDVLVGGPGLDVLDGGPGDDVVIQD